MLSRGGPKRGLMSRVGPKIRLMLVQRGTQLHGINDVQRGAERELIVSIGG